MPRFTLKAPTASGGRIGWWRHVTAVDTTKKNGWALTGEFLKPGLHELPAGSVLVCKQPMGSARRSYHLGSVSVVQPDGDVQIVCAADWDTEFLLIRDAVEEALR